MDEIRNSCDEAAPGLSLGLRDAAKNTKNASVSILERLDPTEKGVNFFANALNDASSYVRFHAAYGLAAALNEFQSDNQLSIHIPILLRMTFTDSSSRVQNACGMAISELGSRAVAEVKKYLQDDEPKYRRAAIVTLFYMEAINDEIEEIVATIEKFDPDKETKDTAALALKKSR